MTASVAKLVFALAVLVFAAIRFPRDVLMRPIKGSMPRLN